VRGRRAREKARRRREEREERDRRRMDGRVDADGSGVGSDDRSTTRRRRRRRRTEGTTRARTEGRTRAHPPRLRLMNAHFSPFMSSRTTSPGRISGTSRGVGVGGGGAPATPPSSSIVVVVVVVVVATRDARRPPRDATTDRGPRRRPRLPSRSRRRSPLLTPARARRCGSGNAGVIDDTTRKRGYATTICTSLGFFITSVRDARRLPSSLASRHDPARPAVARDELRGGAAPDGAREQARARARQGVGHEPILQTARHC